MIFMIEVLKKSCLGAKQIIGKIMIFMIFMIGVTDNPCPGANKLMENICSMAFHSLYDYGIKNPLLGGKQIEKLKYEYVRDSIQIITNIWGRNS